MLDARTHELTAAHNARQMLGMQQLGPHGLSEQWLLRFCGDVHWTLIAGSLGQEGLRFRAADGRPLYAAFCATRLELARTGALLGEDLCITSDLESTGGPKIGSRHVFRHRGQVIGTLLMLSTFVTHDETGSNRRIVRAQPARDCDLPPAGADLLALDDRARQVSRRLRGQTIALDGAKRIAPSYTLDFNAVGLLYFPSFSRFAESAAPNPEPLRLRELVYLGNLDPGETVHVQNHANETLIARSCGRVIAQAHEERGG